MKTFAIAAVVTSVFFINFCATVFQCGCAALWGGAAAHCNVHVAGVHHCPWCTYGTIASVIPYLCILAVQGAVAFWVRGMPLVVRVPAAVAAFPVAGAVVAGVYGLVTGYWR